MICRKLLDHYIRKVPRFFCCLFFCFVIFSCASQDDESGRDYATPRQYTPVRPYYPQEYIPYNRPYSRRYTNPYSYPPQNYYPYYDSDQYYVPPSVYPNYEQDYYQNSRSGQSQSNQARSAGDGGKY